MRLAIYGAGSMGTVLGAYLTKAGLEVDLVNRNKAHVEALRTKGAHISGTVDFTVPVKALLPEEMSGRYDVIFLMTKQLHNPEVCRFLEPLLAEDGVVVTLQNGIPEPAIAEIVGEKRVIGCPVAWGATMKGPGECTLTSEPDSLTFEMGPMGGEEPNHFAEAREILQKMCPVELRDNIMGVRWSKLLINATYSGLGTVIGGTFGDVAKKSKARSVALRVMKECIDVGHAGGVEFAPVQGKDITKLFYYKSAPKRLFAYALIPIAMKKHFSIYPSMLQDLDKGKPCEVDAINGVVCQWGKKYDVPTPLNDRIVNVIKAEQAGDMQREYKNIELFNSLL